MAHPSTDPPVLAQPEIQDPSPKKQGSVRRLRLTIAYDGRSFSGWQSQPNRNGVQDHLDAAFQLLAPDSKKIHGAGRTDAGVHALGQVAHIDVPSARFPPATWLSAVNAHLPPEIRVLKCQIASPAFHAQFSATGKVYCYRIWNDPVFNPLEIGHCWHVPHPLDLELLRLVANRFLGTHDFASFGANRGKPGESTIRTIHAIQIQAKKELLILRFDGNGFLYRMVRMLTGAIVRVAANRESLEWINRLLLQPGKAKASFTAPAEGLYLVKVKYGERGARG
jgi:tRNA pseudouridine38-40 synthase